MTEQEFPVDLSMSTGQGRGAGQQQQQQQQQQANVVIKNQYVYLLDGATINVFDCVHTATGQRDVYYIQKGRIVGQVVFQNQRQQQQQQPSRPRQRQPSSSDSDSDSERGTPSTTGTPATQAQTRAQPEFDTFQEILSSRRTVTDDELKKLAGELRGSWRGLVRILGVEEDVINELLEDRQNSNRMALHVKVTKMLLHWKSHTSMPHVGELARALENADHQSLVVECLKP